MSDSYESIRRTSLDALAEGDPQGAFSKLRPLLEYPGRVDSVERWRDVLNIFARIAQAIAGDELAGHVRAAAAGPDDAEALYELGYELIEQSLHGIAATVLARAYALAPEETPVLFELMSALEGSGHNDEACRLLRAAGRLVEESFVARYSLAYNALMTGDLEEPRRLLPRLDELFAREAPDERITHMREALAGMLERADAVRGVSRLDAQDLRGFHFVVTGGILAHISPFGLEEGMNGRYAYTQDSESRCLEGIRRLGAVLSALPRAPERVFVLPERSSAALALAAAATLDVPAAPWPEGGSDEPGLIVAYDLHELDAPVLESLAMHRPGQLLFVHAARWTEEPPFVGDVTTYLHQMNVTPWGARIGFDPASKEPVEYPPDESAAEEIAARIAGASLEEGALADLAALTAFVEAAAKVKGSAAAGALLARGERRRQRTDSPVKSSRFL